MQLSAIVLNCSEMADKDDSIQKLQVHNYYVWSRRAKAELIERNCWNAIDPGFGDAVDDMNADQQRVNRKAYAFLLKHVADSYVEDIGDTEIAKAAWEILERIHSSFTLVQTVRLLKEMMNQEKTEAQTMHEYMAQIQALNRKIAKGGWNLEFTDRQLAGLFLVGLPEKYDVAVEFLGKEEALSTELVKTRLLREESKRRPNNVALTTSKASTSKAKPDQRAWSGAGSRNQNEKRYPSQPRRAGPGPGSRRTAAEEGDANKGGRRSCYNCNSTLPIARFCDRVKCYKCGLSGHIAKNCATDVGENKPKEGDVKGEGRAGGAGGEEKLRACVSVTTVGLTSQLTAQNAWIVDSGASQHITNRKDWLSDFSECDGDVLTGKGSAKVKGRGKVKVKFSEENGGYTLILSNVLFVPEFAYNLLSVHCLAKKGGTGKIIVAHSVKFEEKKFPYLLHTRGRDRECETEGKDRPKRFLRTEENLTPKTILISV